MTAPWTSGEDEMGAIARDPLDERRELRRRIAEHEATRPTWSPSAYGVSGWSLKMRTLEAALAACERRCADCLEAEREAYRRFGAPLCWMPKVACVLVGDGPLYERREVQVEAVEEVGEGGFTRLAWRAVVS